MSIRLRPHHVNGPMDSKHCPIASQCIDGARESIRPARCKRHCQDSFKGSVETRPIRCYDDDRPDAVPHERRYRMTRSPWCIAVLLGFALLIPTQHIRAAEPIRLELDASDA